MKSCLRDCKAGFALVAALVIGLMCQPKSCAQGTLVSQLPFPAADLAFDPLRSCAYVSGYSNHLLAIVNLTNGVVEQQFNFDWMAESLAVSPDNQQLCVALLRRPHSPYWFGGHTNYIALFDLATRVKSKEFEVDADPYDLLLTDGGILIMTGGSDQSTDIRSYSTATGQLLSVVGGVYNGSRASLHPSQKYF